MENKAFEPWSLFAFFFIYQNLGLSPPLLSHIYELSHWIMQRFRNCPLHSPSSALPSAEGAADKGEEALGKGRGSSHVNAVRGSGTGMVVAVVLSIGIYKHDRC